MLRPVLPKGENNEYGGKENGKQKTGYAGMISTLLPIETVVSLEQPEKIRLLDNPAKVQFVAFHTTDVNPVQS